MKKILFALCAVATFASCSNEEIVSYDKEAIAFDGAFVDNGTRAADSFTIATNKLLAFDVWATTQRPSSTEIVPIMEKVEVSRANASAAWGYGTAYTQYWIPGNNYKFVAAKNYDDDDDAVTLTNGVPSKFAYDAATQKDFIYAVHTCVGKDVDNDAVAFTFDHLLSKAYFTVKTNLMSGANANYTYRITNVCINNAVKEATYDVASETWGDVTANYTDQDPLTFNDVNARGKLAAGQTYTSDLARLLVPVNYTDSNKLNITCTIETLYGDSVIDVKNYEKSISQEFEKGFVYNFVLALSDPGEAIEFTVTKVNEWVSASTPGL